MNSIYSHLQSRVKNEGAQPRRHNISWLIIRVCISAVLLTSASLKLYSGTSIYSSDNSFLRLDPVLFAVLIAFEYAIASFLLFNILPTITLPVTSLFISLLTAISAWLVASGAHSCPCFGYLMPPPWIVLGLDLLMLLSLIRIRPIYAILTGAYRTPIISGIVQLVGLAVLLLGIGVETRYLGTSIGLEGWLQGAFPGPIEVQPKTISLLLSPNEMRQVEFQISNHSSSAFSVVGCTRTCSPFCIENVSLPVDVPPRTTKSAIISVGKQVSPGSYSRELVFYNSSKDQPRISVRINLEVSKPQ